MIVRTSVAVVGAGVTGLALGHYLAAARVPHIVFEADARPGGVIRSARVEGHLLEWGPQRTRLTAALDAAHTELARAEKQLANEKFTSRAPTHLVEAERDKARRFSAEAEEISARLDALG